MSSPLEGFSNVLMGRIMKGVVQITNSSIVTTADIPVIFRSVSRLASSSKTMCSKVLHKDAIASLFQALSEKYGLRHEDIASGWNSPTSRAWLLAQCTKNGDKETYDTTQAIIRVIEGVSKKARAAGLYAYRGNTGNERPNRDSKQIRSGFQLELSSVSIRIFTPLGRFLFYPSHPKVVKNPLDDPEIWNHQQILDHLGAQFERMSLCSYEDNPSFEVTPSEEPKKMICIREIPPEDIATRIGTSSLIFSRGGNSFYQLTKAEDRTLPPVVNYASESEFRDHRTLGMIWDLLSNSIRPVNPRNNVLFEGIDPVISLSQVHALIIDGLRKLLAGARFDDLFPDYYGCLFTVVFPDRNSWLSHHNLNMQEIEKLDLGDLSSGWEQVRLADCPSLKFHKSEKEYLLFRKRDADLSMAHFLELMVAQLKLRPAMFFKFDETYPWPNRADLYVWIHKDHAATIFRLFPFKSKD